MSTRQTKSGLFKLWESVAAPPTHPISGFLPKTHWDEDGMVEGLGCTGSPPAGCGAQLHCDLPCTPASVHRNAHPGATSQASCHNRVPASGQPHLPRAAPDLGTPTRPTWGLAIRPWLPGTCLLCRSGRRRSWVPALACPAQAPCSLCFPDS